MAVKTKAQILTEIASLLADNTAGDISAQDVRTVVNDITDSYEDYITAGTTSQYWRGDKTWQTLPVNEVTGTLTSSQINNMNEVPITVLGVAGANKYYLVENVSMYYIAGTTGFTGDYEIRMRYNTANVTINAVIDSVVLNGTVSKVVNTYMTTDTFGSAIINDSIRFVITNDAGAGNGSIKYSIKYRIISV